MVFEDMHITSFSYLGNFDLSSHFLENFRTLPIMDIILSSRGRNKIAYNGYIYRKDKATQTTISWRCEVKGCKGRLSTTLEYESDRNCTEKGEHSHAPDVIKVGEEMVKEKVLKAAETTHDTPRRILQDAIAGLPDELAANIGSGAKLKSSISRKRRIMGNYPPPPLSAASIIIPESLRLTFTGDNFILYDSGISDVNRVFIFGTKESLAWLKENRHWLVDGTFKTSPSIFLQIFTVHVLIKENVIPCVYVLLTNKCEESYKLVFNKLKSLEPLLDPISVLIDFEIAVKNAIACVFPRANITGCFFHLGQCVWRKIINVGLRERYVNEENVRTLIKMMTCTAFLPTDDVIKGFEALRNLESYNEDLDVIFDYFEDNYIGRPMSNNRRRRPKFPLSMWNVFDRLQTGLPRTNNAVEGWHTAFQGSLSCSHPTVWLLIEALRREESLQRTKYLGIMSGEPLRKKRKYENLERRIKSIIEFREDVEITVYLRHLAYNITF